MEFSISPPPSCLARQAFVEVPAVAAGVLGAALPRVWALVQPVADPFSDERDTRPAELARTLHGGVN